MVSERDISAAIGSTAYGSDGAKVGTVETFYTDDRTGAPTWVAVTSGLLGTKQSIAPAADATFADGRLQLGVPGDAVSRAPRLGGAHLGPEEEAALRRHYAQETTPADATVALPATGHRDLGGRTDLDDRVDLHDRAATGPADLGDRAGLGDGSMVRREEQLLVSTDRVAARRMRVVKYVVTEEVQVTVPVRREEIRIEEVPLGVTGGTDDTGYVTEGEQLDAGRHGPGVLSGGLTGGLPGEIVLHAERPVVTVEVVPVERVRLHVETVVEHETVSDQVQREQVVVDQVPVRPDR